MIMLLNHPYKDLNFLSFTLLKTFQKAILKSKYQKVCSLQLLLILLYKKY